MSYFQCLPRTWRKMSSHCTS